MRLELLVLPSLKELDHAAVWPFRGRGFGRWTFAPSRFGLTLQLFLVVHRSVKEYSSFQSTNQWRTFHEPSLYKMARIDFCRRGASELPGLGGCADEPT